MERLSALDAEFLYLEDDVSHMHIAGACVFDGPAPPLSDIKGLVASKLHLIPRYRQRIRSVPLDLGRPVWVDDPEFDLDRHIRSSSLCAPGDDAAFCGLMGRLMSQQLDRERPLWEAWLVEGLEGGRWALVCKVHHCMVDGIAGVGLLTALLDVEADAAVGEPQPWVAEAEPPAALKVLDAWGGLLSDALATARRLPGSAVHPIVSARTALWTGEGMVRLLRRLVPTGPLSIEGPIGPGRTWAHSSARLEDVRTIRSAFGGTVNDVALAAVSGGYRALLLERGDPLDQAVVRSLVPVSTRHEGDRRLSDNQVSCLLYELPVRIADPVERLEVVQEQMAELKSLHISEAGVVVTSVADFVPPMVMWLLGRVALRSARSFGQHSLSTVTTNVPGPQMPLYCLGHEMLEYRPFVPISHGLRVGLAILSYNGQLFFGATGDLGTMPDIGVLTRGASTEIDALLRRALHD